MIDHSTICALASWTAPCLRGIVRLSGAEAWEIGQSVWSGPAFSGGAALYGAVRLPPGTAPAWAYCFAGPRSYTGEDQLEIHLPGNPLLIRLLLEALVKAGARPAEPGEFTARAYFNGRLDLTEAEGVAAIVSAQNEQELQAGRQLLGGELARRLAPSMEALTQTLALLEVGIDFSEEDVTFLSRADLEERRSRLVQSLDELLADSRRFERLSHEPTVVLAGRPNAGKSSLLNALSQSERAVVSNTPGTTRDALSAEVALARGMIRLVDVAGLEAPCTPLDRQMHDRALRELVEADLAVLLVDAMDQRPPMDLPRQPDLVVHTKADLLASTFPLEAIYISTLTGAGLDRLRERLDELAFGERDPGGTLALNQRHVTAIQQARGVLAALAVDQAEAAPELVADDLRAALDELGGILGQVTPDDVLGRIFSSFCIGK